MSTEERLLENIKSKITKIKPTLLKNFVCYFKNGNFEFYHKRKGDNHNYILKSEAFLNNEIFDEYINEIIVRMIHENKNVNPILKHVDSENITLHEALKVLEDHQIWRLGADTEPTNPKQLTEALDIAINLMKQLNKN